MKRCPHRVDLDLMHCWECEPKANAVVDATCGWRRTGKTTRMLEALPVERTPTVVVHTQAMADYVRRLAAHVRPDLKHPIRVRIVQTVHDCDYLRGAPFVVDHATLEHVSPEVRQMFAVLTRPVR